MQSVYELGVWERDEGQAENMNVSIRVLSQERMWDMDVVGDGECDKNLGLYMLFVCI